MYVCMYMYVKIKKLIFIYKEYGNTWQTDISSIIFIKYSLISFFLYILNTYCSTYIIFCCKIKLLFSYIVYDYFKYSKHPHYLHKNVIILCNSLEILWFVLIN